MTKSALTLYLRLRVVGEMVKIQDFVFSKELEISLFEVYPFPICGNG
jgi:hypothetical protein